MIERDKSQYTEWSVNIGCECRFQYELGVTGGWSQPAFAQPLARNRIQDRAFNVCFWKLVWFIRYHSLWFLL
ncbi:hypothetical protein EVAR_70910_1 [Eumeta japonica]|uniref:Uncharacterized protein n=1 Tax=Eumeta variegata TaxID=151549 RepID=A0A4C2AC77_EUMVA|nr:hypothetical protein EVAR_70910_1 [Eumeta japonica]